MAFNILNIGFDGTVETPFITLTHQSDGDNNDLFYTLGTNFGTANFSNPDGSLVTVNSNGSQRTLNNIDNILEFSGRPESSDMFQDSNTNWAITFNFQNLVVRPSHYQIKNRLFSLYNFQNSEIQGSNDGSNFINLYTSTSLNAYRSTWTPLFNINAEDFYPYIRFRWTQDNFENGGPQYLAIYGDVIRTDNQAASKTSPINSLSNLIDSNISSAKAGDILIKNNKLITVDKNPVYRTSRQTLSNALSIDDDPFLRPNFYILDPGGTNRNVDLPTSPVAGDFIRIRSLNTSFELRIREAGSNQIATIGGLLTQGDFWWDGTEWTALVY